MEYEIRDGLTLPMWETFDAAKTLAELERLYDNGRAFADRVAALESPTFADIIADEDNDNKIARISGPLHHLFMTMKEKYPQLKETVDAANKLGVQYAADMTFHAGLLAAFKNVRAREDFETLTAEQQRVVVMLIESFERAGAGLPKEQQDELRGIDQELASLSTTFADNVTKSTDAWSLHVPQEDAGRLLGIPETVQATMRDTAQKRGLDGALITLAWSSAIAVLEHAHSRELRKEVWTARNARASTLSQVAQDADNSALMPRILALRQRKAELLGFSSFNELSLATKAAKALGVDGVTGFLYTIVTAAQPSAQADFARWQEKGKALGINNIEPWDFGYIANVLANEKFNFDEENVREYFPLSKVLAKLSGILESWWGVTLSPITGASVWHESVTAFAVKNRQGETVAGLYMDLFERGGKQGGAWMDVVLSRSVVNGAVQLPVAHLVSDFRKPADGEAYLSQDEKVTLFHETGHVFHHLLTESNYRATSMMHVEWDTVELPSQFFENWCWEREALKDMSAHRESGEQISDALLDALIAKRHWESGSMAARQALMALFDWHAHLYVSETEEELLELYGDLSQVILQRSVRPEVRFPHAFTHIFSGGYAAGYCSYLIAEGYVADVYAAFKEEGGMHNPEVAERYRKEILAPGASRPMTESFRTFRGRDLDPSKLVPYLGLAE